MIRFSTNDKETFSGYCMAKIQDVVPQWRGSRTFDPFTCSRRHTLLFWNPNLHMSVSFTVIWSWAASARKFIIYFYIEVSLFGSDFSKFYFEVKTPKKTLHKNAYHTKFASKCILKFISNIFVQKSVVTTVPKLELRIVLPCLGNISSITKKRLNVWSFVNLK